MLPNIDYATSKGEGVSTERQGQENRTANGGGRGKRLAYLHTYIPELLFHQRYTTVGRVQ